MSWETVSAAIRFWPDGDGWNTNGTNSGVPFTADQKNQILGLIQQLYFGSSYAQALLEGGTSEGRFISLYQTNSSVPGLAPIPLGSGLAGFNLDAISHEYYFASSGKLVQANPALTIIHELFHAISQDHDPTGSGPRGYPTDADLNDPSFDDVGSAVTDTNIVAAQMGLDLRMSYPADIMNNDPNDNRFSQLRTDISYSDNQPVSVVRFGDMLNDGDVDLIDMSRAVPTAELMLRLALMVKIRSWAVRATIFCTAA